MKKILFGIIILLVTLSFTPENGKLSAETGKLSGVVTLTDSYASSNQADTGCEIYAISEADFKSGQSDELIRVMDNFQLHKSNYSLLVYNTIDPVKIQKARENFDVATEITLNYINGLKQVPAVLQTVTNSAGKYTLSLKPGKNYILFVSGLVKSSNTTESGGNIDYTTANIRTSTEASLNLNFEKKQNALVMFITSWQKEGC
jgi:uncharacterized protein YxeA